MNAEQALLLLLLHALNLRTLQEYELPEIFRLLQTDFVSQGCGPVIDWYNMERMLMERLRAQLAGFV